MYPNLFKNLLQTLSKSLALYAASAALRNCSRDCNFFLCVAIDVLLGSIFDNFVSAVSA